MNINNTFGTDWISSPGDTVLDIANEKNWNLTELSSQLGWDRSYLLRFLDGGVPMTKIMAKDLSAKIGGTESFWINRDNNYRKQLTQNYF